MPCRLVSEDDGFVRFTIEGDGVGFEPQSIEHGAGLVNIADRVSAAGGSVRIDSAKGAGTRVQGQLPV